MDAATHSGAGHGAAGGDAVAAKKSDAGPKGSQPGGSHSGGASDRDAMAGSGSISAAAPRCRSISGVLLPGRRKKNPMRKAAIEKNPATSSLENPQGRGVKRLARRGSEKDTPQGSRSPSGSSHGMDDFMPLSKMPRQEDTGGAASTSRVTQSSVRRGGVQVPAARDGGRRARSTNPRKKGECAVRFEGADVPQDAPAGPAPTAPNQQKLNIRCCPQYVLGLLHSLNQKQREYVQRKGFGSLFEMTVEALETRDLLHCLLENTDPRDMIIRAGPGKNLEITKDVIHHILGLPNSGGLPEKPTWSDGVKEAANFKASLGLGKGNFTVDMMKEEVTKGGADDLTMRCFFVIVFNRLLLCKGCGDITNDHIFLTRGIEDFAEFDWCQLIYNDLCHAVRKWHNRVKDNVTATVYGCSIVILLFYLDHLYDNAAPPEKTDAPRFKYFDSARIQNLIKADHKDGRWGSCDFRSRTQTCYAQGTSIYIPRLRGLLASSWERTRCQVDKQIELAQNFSEVIDVWLHADNSEQDPTIEDDANAEDVLRVHEQGGGPALSSPEPCMSDDEGRTAMHIDSQDVEDGSNADVLEVSTGVVFFGGSRSAASPQAGQTGEQNCDMCNQHNELNGIQESVERIEEVNHAVDILMIAPTNQKQKILDGSCGEIITKKRGLINSFEHMEVQRDFNNGGLGMLPYDEAVIPPWTPRTYPEDWDATMSIKHISEIKQSVEQTVQQYVEKAATVFDTTTLPPSPKKLDRTPGAPLQLPESACTSVKYAFQKIISDLKNLQTLANAEQFNQQIFIEEIIMTLDAWENFFSSHFTEEIKQMVTKLKFLKIELDDSHQPKNAMAELSEKMKNVGEILDKAVLVREKITKSGMEIEQMRLAGTKSQESLNALETAHAKYIEEQERKITEAKRKIAEGKENLRLVQLLKAKNADFVVKEIATSQAISEYSSSFEEATDKGNALSKEIAKRCQQVEEDGDLPAPLQAMRFLIARYPFKE